MSKLATVIGAHGFIGGHLMERLQRDGWRCQASPRDHPSLLRRELGTVFYCAGLTADYAQRPHDTVRAHVALLNDILTEAQFDALVYLSSTRLYDSLPGVAMDEDSGLLLNPAQPRHLYDLSKALGESLCRHASQGRARVARLACVYAAADDADGFMGSLLRQVQEHQRQHPRQHQRQHSQQHSHRRQGDNGVLEIDTSASFSRDYVHLDDVLDALLHIATTGTQTAYNVASGVNVSNAQLFERLSELTGCDIRATRSQRLPCAAPVSIARMRSEFGWQPASVLDRLEHMVRGEVAC